MKRALQRFLKQRFAFPLVLLVSVFCSYFFWRSTAIDNILNLLVAPQIEQEPEQVQPVSAAQYTALLEELETLRQSLDALETVSAENQRLSLLLEMPIPPAYRQIGARVVARAPDRWRQEIQINQGFSQGIRPNQVVLNTHGVVGKVISTSAEHALVQLITSPKSALSSKGKDGLIGIVKGGGDLAKFEWIEGPLPKVGDRLKTSGLGEIYPRDLVLGSVKKIVEKPGYPTPDIYLELHAFNQPLYEVVVLLPR